MKFTSALWYLSTTDCLLIHTDRSLLPAHSSPPDWTSCWIITVANRFMFLLIYSINKWHVRHLDAIMPAVFLNSHTHRQTFFIFGDNLWPVPDRFWHTHSLYVNKVNYIWLPVQISGGMFNLFLFIINTCVCHESNQSLKHDIKIFKNNQTNTNSG